MGPELLARKLEEAGIPYRNLRDLHAEGLDSKGHLSAIVRIPMHGDVEVHFSLVDRFHWRCWIEPDSPSTRRLHVDRAPHQDIVVEQFIVQAT